MVLFFSSCLTGLGSGFQHEGPCLGVLFMPKVWFRNVPLPKAYTALFISCLKRPVQGASLSSLSAGPEGPRRAQQKSARGTSCARMVRELSHASAMPWKASKANGGRDPLKENPCLVLYPILLFPHPGARSLQNRESGRWRGSSGIGPLVCGFVYRITFRSLATSLQEKFKPYKLSAVAVQKPAGANATTEAPPRSGNTFDAFAAVAHSEGSGVVG